MAKVQKGEIPHEIELLRKPIACVYCEMRFPDVVIMASHKKRCGNPKEEEQINTHGMSVAELKKELKKRGESDKGAKVTLVTRLENVLAYEKL